MDKISYWWYGIGLVCIGYAFYAGTDQTIGIVCLFAVAFLLRLLVHWLINKYILHKTNKLCSAINRCKNVIELDSIMAKFIEQKNYYVLDKAETAVIMRITDETVQPLPYQDAVCYGRDCFYKLSASVWLNPRKQTEWTQVFVFNDSIDFISSGHISYNLSDILELKMENRNRLCLILRNKNDGIYIQSDSAYLLYLIIRFLKKKNVWIGT